MTKAERFLIERLKNGPLSIKESHQEDDGFTRRDIGSAFGRLKKNKIIIVEKGLVRLSGTP